MWSNSRMPAATFRKYNTTQFWNKAHGQSTRIPECLQIEKTQICLAAVSAGGTLAHRGKELKVRSK